MSSSSSTTISAELGLRLVVPQQTIVPLVASLYYSARDPYAVRMAFHVGTDEPVEWIFARDLLAAGIESRPAGNERSGTGVGRLGQDWRSRSLSSVSMST